MAKQKAAQDKASAAEVTEKEADLRYEDEEDDSDPFSSLFGGG